MSRIAVVVLSTLAWPVVQLLLFLLRFRHMPPGGPSEALAFAPMGLVAGVVAAVLMTVATRDGQRRAILWGYLAACPFALIGSLLGGLVLPGIWGPLVTGGALLGVGCLVGFAIGRTRTGGTS